MGSPVAADILVAPADRLVTMPPFQPGVRSLGFGVVEWMKQHLIQPDGPRAGQPFQPSPDQVQFLLWFYALSDDGRWMFNLGVRRLAKGKGKSPFAAAVALAEFLGPVRLDCFDDRVELGGVRAKTVAMPLVQIVAAAESQTKNTMRFVRAFCPKNGPLAKKYNIDVGKTQFFKQPEGTLEVITSSSTAAEGAQCTFAVGDEPEHWTPSNQGPDLNSTIIDNLTKTGGRMLHTCNAWRPGIGSVAEDTWDDWVAQEEGRTRGDQRILYDARVAPPDTDMSDRQSLMAALEHCYKGSPWVDLENVVQRIWRISAKPDDSLRKYLNRPTAPADAWVDSSDWAVLADPERRIADGEPVVLFFDGSKSSDATALVACQIDDGFVQTVAVWEPDGEHDIDTADVDRAVIEAFQRWDVMAFFADVQEWQGFVKGAGSIWPDRYSDRLRVWADPKNDEPIAWDMRGRRWLFAQATEQCYADIVEQSFNHDGHPITTRHIGNCRRRAYREFVTVGKESAKSPKKIDAAVCVIGARMVRSLVLKSPEWARRNRSKSGRVKSVVL